MSEIAEERTYLRHGVRVEEGAVVLDVGANVGVAAVFFAAECGAARVHSFEPVAPLFELLRENTRYLPACVAHDYGLYRESCRAQIAYYPGSAAMSGLYADPDADSAVVRQCLINLGRSEEEAEAEVTGRYRPVTMDCELRTLSAAIEAESVDAVDLLKIDVEKAERDVIMGIEEADWPRIKQLAIEVHGEAPCSSIDGILRERGYRVSVGQAPAMRGTPIRMLYARRR